MRKQPPRLYLDRGQWRIRDGQVRIRTGFKEGEQARAAKALADYIAKGPEVKTEDPTVEEVLSYYRRHHLPNTRAQEKALHFIARLGKTWGTRRIRSITAQSCREYADGRSPQAARRELEILRAALRFFDRECGPLGSLPRVILPPKAQPRERWLTRDEVAKILRSAKGRPHLQRFILIGIYTGSRSGAIRQATWEWVDWKAGTMLRRAPGKAEDKRKRTPRVRLHPRLLAHLRRWHRLDGGHGPIVHFDGRPVGKIRRSWMGAAIRAGLVDVTPHTMRHTRATWLMQAGVAIWEAAGSLGMTPEVLARTYGHHHPDYQDKAANVDGRKR